MRVLEHTPPGSFKPLDVEPVLFLAGPIQGAPDWQAEALSVARDLWDYPSTLHIINPRWAAKPDVFVKNDQISWEKRYLKRASILGGMVFYLAAESRDAPFPNKPGRSYAQTTRHEFGRAAGWKDNEADVIISLGMEDGYVGNEDYYRHTADEFNLTIHDTVQDTVAESISTIKFMYGRVLSG